VGRKAHIVAADLAHPEATAQLATQAVEAFGKLDIVVNNVGGTMPNTLLTTSTKDLKDALPSTSLPPTRSPLPRHVDARALRRRQHLNITSTMGRLADAASRRTEPPRPRCRTTRGWRHWTCARASGSTPSHPARS